jgi:D-alanine-D-alanine ligase
MLEPVCRSLLEEHRQPVLVEEFLPGREFTVGLIGTGPAAEALGTMEVHFGPRADPGIYTFDNKAHWEGRVSYALLTEEPLVQTVEALAVSAWRALGCRDGGRLDIRLDAAGVPNFIEANPLAGLNPGHSDLPFICRFKGISFDQLIQRIVASALSRVTRPSPISPGTAGQ